MGLGKGLTSFRRIAKHTPGGVEHDQTEHGNWSEGTAPSGMNLQGYNPPGSVTTANSATITGGLAIKYADPIETVGQARNPTNPRLYPEPDTDHYYERVLELQALPGFWDTKDSPERIEADRLYEEASGIKRKWHEDIEDAITFGEIDPETAKSEYGYFNRGGDQWGVLPDTVYHVTSAGPQVRAEGLLTRDEILARDGGTEGLGGGASDTISLTDSPEVAYDIHRAMLELHDVTNEKITFDDMEAKARLGDISHFGDEQYKMGTPFWDGWLGNKDPSVVEALRDGTGRKSFYGTLADAEKATREITAEHPGATNIHPIGDPVNKAGTHWMNWGFTRSPEDAKFQIVDAFKGFLSSREYVGKGPTDPLFWMFDEKTAERYAATPREDIQLLTFNPVKPGIMGKQMGALNEWRVTTGEALRLVDEEQTAPVVKRLGISKHHGPGPHSGTMSPQSVHGGATGGVGDTKKFKSGDRISYKGRSGTVVDSRYMQKTKREILRVDFDDIFNDPDRVPYTTSGIPGPEVKKITKHYPGGVDHDQNTHGDREGAGESSGAFKGGHAAFRVVGGTTSEQRAADLQEATARLASGKTLHRGIGLVLPEDLKAKVLPLLGPAMEESEMNNRFEAGKLILDHITENGIGRHWTTDLDWAEKAAERQGGLGFETGQWNVIVEIEPPDPSMLNPVQDRQGMSEEEVTLNPNGPYTYRSLVVQGGTWWDNENLLETPITKHYGPGPHASGTSQDAHGKKGSGGGSSLQSGEAADTATEGPFVEVTEEAFEARLLASSLPIETHNWQYGGMFVELKDGKRLFFGAPPGKFEDGGVAPRPAGRYIDQQLTAVLGVYENKKGRALWDAVGGDLLIQFDEVPGAAGKFSRWDDADPNAEGTISIETGRAKLVWDDDGKPNVVTDLDVPRLAKDMQSTLVHELGHALDFKTGNYTYTPPGSATDSEPRYLYSSSLAFDDYGWTRAGTSGYTTSMDRPDDIKRPEGVPDLDALYRPITGSVIWSDTLPKGQRTAWRYPAVTSFKQGDTVAIKEFYAETVRYWFEKPSVLKGLVRTVNSRELKQWTSAYSWQDKGPKPEPISERVLIDWVEYGLRKAGVDIPVTKADDRDEPLFNLTLDEEFDWPEGMSVEELRSLIVRDRITKHYPGGKDHDQKLHGRRGSVSRRIHADQPNLFVDQPRLGDPEPPKPSLIGRDRSPSTGPLKIADDYVLGKWVEDSYGKGWKDNIDEIVKIREHIDKDPVGALNGLGEHYRWLASKEQVEWVVSNGPTSSFDASADEHQRLKEQWMYEDDNVLALMSEAAEKAEPILIADGERIAEEIRLAEKTKKTAGGPLDRPKSPTWTRGFYYETEGDSASDENAMYRNFIERVAPEQSAQVDKAFELHEQSKVKDDKQRAVFDKFREVTRQPNSEYDERYEVPRDLFTPSTLAEYDKRVRVMRSLYESQTVDFGDLRTSHRIRVELEDGFPYSEDLGDVTAGRVGGYLPTVDVVVGEPFEGTFFYKIPVEPYFADGDLKFRRGKSIFDEGNLQPLFFAADNDMLGGNVDIYDWAKANEGGDSILITKRAYTNLLRAEGSSLERASRRDHKKAKGIINIVDANLKQSGGLEQTVIDVLGKRRDMGGTIDVHGRGTTQAAKQLQMAAEAYPTEWVDRSNDAGPLRVVGKDYVRAMYTNEYRRTLRRKPGESRYGRRSSVIESRILVSPGGVLRDDTLHELAHRMEHVIPEIRILERNFYARRTKGETFQRLSRLTGNPEYGVEMAKPDKWGIPYMGKEYGVRGAPTRIHSGDHFPTTSEAYELLTTAYPVITGRADNDLDDEHRNLMLGILANI